MHYGELRSFVPSNCIVPYTLLAGERFASDLGWVFPSTFGLRRDAISYA
jgi:hypothetical protein